MEARERVVGERYLKVAWALASGRGRERISAAGGDESLVKRTSQMVIGLASTW